MVEYAKNETLGSKPSANLFFTLLFNMHLKYEQDSKLFKSIISSIGSVLGSTREVITCFVRIYFHTIRSFDY